MARSQETVFEVCLTSNYQSGVVSELEVHPIVSMVDAGLITTLNTDDPSVSKITLGEEYRVACEKFDLTLAVLNKCNLAAARASFLPEDEKDDLTKQLEVEWGEKIPSM